MDPRNCKAHHSYFIPWEGYGKKPPRGYYKAYAAHDLLEPSWTHQGKLCLTNQIVIYDKVI